MLGGRSASSCRCHMDFRLRLDRNLSDKNLGAERKLGPGKNPCGSGLFPKKGAYISVCPVDMQSQWIQGGEDS